VAKLYSRSARAAWFGGNTPLGLRLSLEGMDRISADHECPELAQLIHEAARASYFNGLPDRARTLCRQSLEMAQRLAAVEVQADALATLGVLPGISPEESIAALRRSVELAESHGHLHIAARAHHNLGSQLRAFRLDQREGLPHFHRSAELDHQRGTLLEEVFSLLPYAGNLAFLGRTAEAVKVLNTVEEMAGQLPDPAPVLLEFRCIRAPLTCLEGRWEQVLATLHEGLDSARRTGDQQNIINRCLELADLYHQLTIWGLREGWGEAESLLKEAAGTADRMSSDRVPARAYLSVIYARQGNVDGARRSLGEAETIQGPSPTSWDALSLATARPELATAEQRWDDAVEGWGELVALHNRMGARLFLPRSLVGLAEAHAERRGPADLERAQALLREAMESWRQLGSHFFGALVEQKLKQIQALALEHAQAQGEAVLELEQAGRIQETFLPEPPTIPGWEFAALLKPARVTSGDFYDFLRLPSGKLGIVIADVADKGAGAALLMASTQAMLRTLADQFPDQPDRVLVGINRRLLLDSRSGLFVTLFYGILDPASGDVVYASAGHLPALLQPPGDRASLQELGRTGMPLGITEEATWEVESAHMDAGSRLVLYTDGVSEAQDPSGEFYGPEGLVRSMQAGQDRSALRGIEKLAEDVQTFVGDSELTDDLTIVLVRRDEARGKG
jgi:serine phosphatase RsbU (regulator of sigma subunit)